MNIGTILFIFVGVIIFALVGYWIINSFPIKSFEDRWIAKDKDDDKK